MRAVYQEPEQGAPEGATSLRIGSPSSTGKSTKCRGRCADTSRVPRFARRLLPRLLPWILLALALWVGQLWYIGHTTVGWSSYWSWRGWYRPGIQVVQTHGGEYLPGHTFHPLSPTGARLAFALAAAVYAAGATLICWAALRLTRSRRKRLARAMTRPRRSARQ